MEIKKYLGKLIDLFNRQKILFIIGGVTLIMLLSVAGMSMIGSNSRQNPAGTNPLPQTASINASATAPVSNPQSPPPPENAPWTTKFIYFIGGIFNQNKPTAQSSHNISSGAYRPGSSVPAQPASAAPVSDTQSAAGNSGDSNSSGSSNGSQSGNSQANPSNPPSATPTPVTQINIVFVNEDGVQWTYVPPAVPPIDTEWVRYTNYQDHYSIEYPADWIVIKSDYNGHEGITLYMPESAGDIDKPSIAFVGWKADYLSSSARYTGQIIINNNPGTIYTNGPFGPSSVAAVFQYQYGYFAMGSSTSNDIFMYVFDHMLRSLNFNI